MTKTQVVSILTMLAAVATSVAVYLQDAPSPNAVSVAMAVFAGAASVLHSSVATPKVVEKAIVEHEDIYHGGDDGK